MKIRATLLMVLLGACGGHHGAMRVDSPVTPYQAPDISELTGIDEDEPASAEDSAPAATPTPAPAPAAPVAPAKK
ncbi:hypothetical protein BH11MYX1_BH11MYX1_22060 [soil metagenome]